VQWCQIVTFKVANAPGLTYILISDIRVLRIERQSAQMSKIKM